MNVLVVGATGMTGGPLVTQLLAGRHEVRVIVRSPEKLPAEVRSNPNLTVTPAAVLDLTDEELAEQVRGCDAVVSCLGHVVSFKGMFGQPRKLCTDAVRRLCDAIVRNGPAVPVRFVLMSTVGVRNPDLGERRTRFDRFFLTLLRYTLPPHRDNETAAEHLHRVVGRTNPHVEWCAVRPDTLINAEVSAYDIEASPLTTIFKGRPTTRSNVAHFMKSLLEDDELFRQWKFSMPVIMNAVS